MSNPESIGTDFLREKYKLQSSPEAQAAAKRTRVRTGKEVADKPDTIIENYLGRLKEIFEVSKTKEPEDRLHSEERISALRRLLHKKFIIKPDDIPESYFENIIQRHKEEGRPIEEIPTNLRAELTATLINDQTDSLDLWIDYFASPDAKYPTWLEYWAFRNILVMGRYDKEKKKFTERSKTGKSVSPFPDLNREALGFVFDAMEKSKTGQDINYPYDVQSDDKNRFQEYLRKGNFPKLYAWAIEIINPISKKLMQRTEGEWRKFPKGSDYIPLAESLANYGTGWCIRGEATAKRYLAENDLEIFYSLDEENKPKVPRVVIVTQADGRISEVRGVAEQENLDQYVGDVVQKKLAELPDGKKFEKRLTDMRILTAIDKKVKAGQQLNREDLVFLYEIDSPIEGFGYQRDPRIQEIRRQRNPKEDAPIVFECTPEEIAWGESEISPRIKAYVGPLFKGIFDRLLHLEHIFTSFPEARIRRSQLEIGGKTAQELERELEQKGFKIYDYARDMLRSKDFTTQKNPETIDLVRLKVRDLGFTDYVTTDQLYARAQELGLELCPAEVGPHQRLEDVDQPMEDHYRIAMKQIADRNGDPSVFYLERRLDGLWLYYDIAYPTHMWNPNDEFVFRLRKISSES